MEDVDHFINAETAKLAEERKYMSNINDQVTSRDKKKWSQNMDFKLASDIIEDTKTDNCILDIGLDPRRKDRTSMLQDQRKKEYNDLISKTNDARPSERNVNNKENDYSGLVAQLGSYQDKRLRLQEERKQEYNRILEQDKQKRSRNRRSEDNLEMNQTKAPIQPQPVQLSEQIDHSKSNASMNAFPYREIDQNDRKDIRQQYDQDSDRYPRDLLQSFNGGVSQRAWESPAPRYEELLEKKRKVEKEYRRLLDATSAYEQPHKSLEYNGNYLDRNNDMIQERNFKPALNNHFESNKPRRIVFEDETQIPQTYREMNKPPATNKYEQIVPQKTKELTPPPTATLLIGRETTSSADKRRKEEYRQELLKQMQEAKINKNKEKIEYFSPPTNEAAKPLNKYETQTPRTAKPPVQMPERMDVHPSNQVYQQVMKESPVHRPQFESQMAEAYFLPRPIEPNLHRYSDAMQPPSVYQSPPQQYDAPNQGSYYPPDFAQRMFTAGLRPDGVLLNGFDFNRPRFVNQRQDPFAMPQSMLQNSPLEEALYALQTNRNQINSVPNNYAIDPMRNSTVYNATPTYYQSPPSQPGQVQNYGNLNAGDNQALDRKKQYQLELQQQMQEAKIKKLKDKEENAAYDRKVQAEVEKYSGINQGGGANSPLRDQFGNVIGNRRRGSASHNPWNNALSPPGPVVSNTTQLETWRAGVNLNLPSGDQLTPVGQAPDSSHARGGNGIFGDPMSDEQKKTKSKYQEELQQQINDKKRREQEEKEIQQREEEKFLKKVEEDNLKLKRDQEEEQRKAKEKAEADEKRQQELKKAQEEVRLEQERKKQEQRAARDDARRNQEAIQERQRLTTRDVEANEVRYTARPPETHRPDSQINNNFNQPGSTSPPVPTKRRESKQSAVRNSRVENKEVLAQLSKMRHLLENEKKRISSASLKEDENINTTEQSNSQIAKLPEIKKTAMVKKSQQFIIPRNDKQNISMMDSLAIGNNQKVDELKLEECVPTTYRLESSKSKKESSRFTPRKSSSPILTSFPEMDNSSNEIPVNENVWKRSITPFKDVSEEDKFDDKLESNTQFLEYSMEPFIDEPSMIDNNKENNFENVQKPNSVLDDLIKRRKSSIVSLDAEELQKKNEEILRRLDLIGENDDILGYSEKYKSQGRVRLATPADDSWMRSISRN